MSHLALYRKYRSQTFGDLVGQEHVVRTLQNALGSGQISHAFLFTGPRGTGKTSTARLVAKALNCEKGPATEPCNECEFCQTITDGSCLDVLEMDAASDSGVEEVREKIVAIAEYRPTVCRFKVIIIDEVHDLSPKAFDALLKTIEEPPAHLVFIMATTELGKVPMTIRSRCQKFEFNRGTVQELTLRLKHVAELEQFQAEPSALAAIARMADGGFRDALSLLEQAALTGGGNITLQLVYDQLGLIATDVIDRLIDAIAESNHAAVLNQLEAISRSGRDPKSIVESLIFRLAELTRASYGVEIGASEDAAIEASTHAQAVKVGAERLLEYRVAMAEALAKIRDVSLPRLWLETLLMKLATPSAAPRVQPAARAERTMAPPAPAEPAAPTPTPVAKPVEKAAAPAPAPRAVVQPAKSGDPLLDEARQLWVQLVSQLGAQSATLRGRLEKTFIDACDGKTVSVLFEQEFQHDKFKEQPKQQAAVMEMWKTVVGERGWVLKFGVKPKNGAPAAHPVDEAVEMPLEGEALARATEETFKGF